MELVEDIGLYDYGARWYDPAVGRWTTVDPKADLQEMITPYAYSLNSPILYIDPDGSLPILINGNTGADTERGDESYWSKSLLNTIANSGMPNPGGGFHFVDGNVGATYPKNGRGKIMGSANGVSTDAAFPAFQRNDAGRLMADREFKSILAKLERDPESGLITENIQIYSHSRGGAFAQGFTERLLELIEDNAEQFANPSSVVDFGLHLAPHQSNDITAADGVDSYSISHTGDGLSGNDMSGSTNFHTNTSSGLTSHKNRTFATEVQEFVNAWKSNGAVTNQITNDFVAAMKKHGVKVTVQ